MSPDRPLRGLAWLLSAVVLIGCGGNTELARTQKYMDSLAVYLGALRLMDHELEQEVTADTMEAETIVPLIVDRFRPTVTDLRARAAALPTTPAIDSTHALLLRYLDTRIAAYDAAIQGRAEARTDLYEVFARKQIEAQSLGDALEASIETLRAGVPGDPGAH